VPYAPTDLTKLLLSATRRYVDELPAGVVPDLVVIGQQSVPDGLLDRCMDAALEETRFLPQEGFLDLILFGFDWWTPEWGHYLNHACTYYEGLAYVRDSASTRDFEWPTVDATPVREPHGADEKQRGEQTELNKLGYNVARDGPSRHDRWQLLRTIIEGRQMTLQEVVGTIAWYCRERRKQHDGEIRFARAIGEWEHDLQLLKTTYYDPGPMRWSWPSVRPS